MFVCSSGLASCVQAQQPTPSLPELLQRLQANLDHDDARLPSLFCDEHLISRVEVERRSRDTVTDSIFRLQRRTNAQHTASFDESRDLKRVDGKPATSQTLNGPALLTGAFEGALSIVSSSQLSCMRYDLKHKPGKHPNEPYLIRFTTAPKPANTDDCFLQEGSKGYALVDPGTMQVTHLELTTAHHIITPATAYASPVVAKRVLTLDYAPVTISGELFWLPSAIGMQATQASGTFHPTVWSFQATYRNYHRLQVTSRILSAPE